MARLLIISPLFNEVRHIRTVANAVARQTRLPDAWIAVDDGSTDGTLAVLRELDRELSFLRVIVTPPSNGKERDRLDLAREIKAFNRGVESAGGGWDLIGKLDGDMELPRDYFERLLELFDREPRLGIAGGRYIEPVPGGGWRKVRIPDHNVPGALKLYSAECLHRIGGVPEALAWDTIDETYARMRGFETRSLPDLVARHHRRTGAVAGVLRGRARHGACAWISHYPAYFALLRSLKAAMLSPRGLSGAAFLWGYVRAAMAGTPRVGDDAFRQFIRAELRDRTHRWIRPTPVSGWKSRRERRSSQCSTRTVPKGFASFWWT